MTRRLKPENELRSGQKWNIAYEKKHPEKREARLQRMKANYNKRKLEYALRKKVFQKKKREGFYKIFGNKCQSCGDLYNPHLKRSNLHFDHMMYLDSKNYPKSTIYQMDDLIKTKQDLTKYFLLLCIDCHRVATAIRKNPTKAKQLMDLLNNLQNS